MILWATDSAKNNSVSKSSCHSYDVHVDFLYYSNVVPLTYMAYDGKDYVVGVVSWGHGCGDRNKAGVYGRVTKVLGWINKQLGKRC